MKFSFKSVVVITIFLALGMVVFGAYLIFWQRPNFDFTYTEAAGGGLEERVKTEGIVKAADDVELAFERSGKIGTAPAKIGDQVRSGDILASLVNSDILAQLAQARAGVASAQAQYENALAGYEAQQALLSGLQNGATPQDIAVSQSAVDSAEKNLNDAEANLNNVKAKTASDMSGLLLAAKDTLNAAYAQTFEAVNTKTADMFTGSQTDDPKLTFFINDENLAWRIEGERGQANLGLAAIKYRIDNLPLDKTGVETAINTTIVDLKNTRNLFTDLEEGLNLTVSSLNFTEETITAYKVSANLALADVNAAITSLQTRQQAIIALAATNQNLITIAQSQVTQAQNGLDLAQKQLVARKAGPTSDQIQAQKEAVAQAESVVSAQKAAIASARASIMNFQAQYDKTLIKAPFDGVVTRQDAKVGEIVSPNRPVIGLISQSRFKLETMVPEDDIAQIEVGQTAEVTLDVSGGDTEFSARIVSIDPGAQLINGQPTYKTTLLFNDENDLIKAGLTANIDIIIGGNADALIVPKTAVIVNDYNSYVLVGSASSRPELRPVTTGLEGTDKIQIVSGLKTGEEIVTFGSNRPQ